MIRLINHIDTLTSAIPVNLRYNSVKNYLENNLCIKVTGNIKTSDKIMICLHGMGGSKEGNYINSLTNWFMDEFKFNGCVIAPDMPGIGDSINTETFWGIQKNVADVYIDDIIRYIVSLNQINNRKIFLVGFSGSCGSIISYFTDDGSIISNNNANLITHTYLISPTGPFLDSLIWIRDNSIFNKYISLSHTMQQFKFILKKKKFNLLSRLNKDTFFDIMLSNIWINGNDEYKFNFGKEIEIKNCDIFLSKYDPITNYDITIKFLNSLNGVNIIESIFGGHIAFFNPLSKKKRYEKHIINSIKKYEQNSIKEIY